jgi:hypothetical membrane protein
MSETVHLLQTARARVAGTCWALAAIIYLATEGLAARAFTPTYSYLSIFISDLGIPECNVAVPAHELQCSPLYALMNGGFMVEGFLFIFAVALLFSLLRAQSLTAFAVLSVAHGVGLWLVALFHAGPQEMATHIPFHVIGAILAIIGGNLAIWVSPAPRELQAPGFIRSLTRWAPVLGIASALLIGVAQAAHTTLLFQPATWERLSVYTIILWEGLFGTWLLLSGGRTAGGA